MSETYPKKDHCETLFAGHISLQRRNRGQRYYKICGCARKKAKKSLFQFNGRPLNASKRATVQCLEAGNICQTTGKNLTCGGNLLGGKSPSTELICGVGKNEIFSIFLKKNLEIQGFIIIFVIAFRSKEQGIRNKDLISLTIIINKPKISLTELRRLIIKVLQDKVLYASELIAILHGSERNCAVIVR